MSSPARKASASYKVILLQFPFEGFVEDGGQEGVEFSGGLRL